MSFEQKIREALADNFVERANTLYSLIPGVINGQLVKKCQENLSKRLGDLVRANKMDAEEACKHGEEMIRDIITDNHVEEYMDELRDGWLHGREYYETAHKAFRIGLEVVMFKPTDELIECQEEILGYLERRDNVVNSLMEKKLSFRITPNRAMRSAITKEFKTPEDFVQSYRDLRKATLKLSRVMSALNATEEESWKTAEIMDLVICSVTDAYIDTFIPADIDWLYHQV